MYRISISLLTVLFTTGLFAQNYIWGGPGNPNSEFAGGLNDWTVQAISPNDKALWVWEADGAADRGAHANNSKHIIESPSVSNGAMVFDSDYYDNDGKTGYENEGTGLAAGPQIGELISPEFSCTGHTNISVTWNQYLRALQSTCELQVTIDGGANWTSFPIHSSPATDSSYVWNKQSKEYNRLAAREKRIIDISSVAANQEKVQFKFVFHADYYYWIIDDVAVIETPQYDIKISKAYHPFNSYQTTRSMIHEDTLLFAAEIVNLGSLDINKYALTARIVDAEENDQYILTQEVNETIKAGDTTMINISQMILPKDIDLKDGLYQVIYEVNILDENHDEYIKSDNIISKSAEITHKINTANQNKAAYRFNDGEFIAFSVFRTGDLPDDDIGHMSYYATDVSIGGLYAKENTVGDQEDGKINTELIVYVFKIKNQKGEELDPVFESTSFGGPNEEPHPNLEYVGYSIIDIKDGKNFTSFNEDLLDTDDESGIILEQNTSYLVGVMFGYYDTPKNLYIGANTDIDFNQPISLLHQPDGWKMMPNNMAWNISLSIQNHCFTKCEEQNISTLKLYPNPAVNHAILQLEFKKPTNAQAILRNEHGKMIQTKSVNKLMSYKLIFSTEHLPAGNYYIEIITDKGTKSVEQFVVVK